MIVKLIFRLEVLKRSKALAVEMRLLKNGKKGIQTITFVLGKSPYSR